MLLGHLLLAPTAATVWRHRERIEHEASDQFARLATELEAIGAHAAVVNLARTAAGDETTHAAMCRALVVHYGAADLAPHAPVLGGHLGPRHAPRDRRALYACVAISCVTETLSAALLLRMRDAARDDLVRDTVHHILKDEIDHSRIGWAHLAHEAGRSDVSWLTPHVVGMLRAAMTTELAPMSGAGDLSAHGVLTSAEVARIYSETVAEVIQPGLARFGISVPS